MTKPLDGKRALVTGAASGIGRAIARAFVEAGAVVTAADCNPEVNGLAAAMGAQRAKIFDATDSTSSSVRTAS
jgi:3-oxoacyl-[acyl-carrier protein] reductase